MRHQYDTYPEPKRNSIQIHNTLFAHNKQNKAKQTHVPTHQLPATTTKIYQTRENDSQSKSS